MPISTQAGKAAEQVGHDRGGVIAHVLNYANSELLCHRADYPSALQDRQQEIWQPLLDWAAGTLKVRLRVTEAIRPIDQPAEALSRLRSAVEALDDRTLAALAVLTQASGSLIVGLALIHGHIDAEAAMSASQLDERWQQAKWGEDADDRKRRDALKDEIQAALDYLALVQGREGS